MDYSEFYKRFGGSLRTKNVFPLGGTPEEVRRKADKRLFLLTEKSELPKEFIRLCPWEAEYMFTIARRARKGILETGRFNGGSLFLMACATTDEVPIYSIDIAPQDDAFLRSTLDKVHPGRAIDLIVGDSQNTKYPQIAEIDLLFIDGDHTYQGCMNDIVNWYDQLAPNGHLVLHDTYLGEHGVQDAILDFMLTHPELETVRSPFISPGYWHYPTGSIAHLIKR